jgi:hypothetical protein
MVTMKASEAKARQHSAWIWSSAFGVACVITYLANSFLLDTVIAGYEISLYAILMIGFGSFLLVIAILRHLWKKRYVTEMGLQGTFISSIVSLVGLIILDSSYSAYIHASAPKIATFEDRYYDKNVLVGELYPHLYYPTDRNFRLLKPGVTVSGTHYGNYYRKEMLESPTLVKDVLDPRTVKIEIDKNGFRENTAINSAHIFALGDSFTFGWGVNQESIWSSIIEREIGQTVYNLGIHDSSPKQEVELIKHVIQNLAGKIDLVLWQIYEGNDLEDSYSETPPQKTEQNYGIKQVISDLFRGLKRNSIVYNFRSGQARLAIGKDNSGYDNSHEIEGVSLATPVFFSKIFGPSLFLPEHIKKGSQPESYVLNHENRPLMDKTFEEMRDLANKNNFDVVVIIAPTVERLHGKYFDGFPELSKEPHFINYVENLSKRNGFKVVNLYELFQPYANSKFLYFRDDDHWNTDGHRMAAKSILQEVFNNEIQPVGQ